MQNLCLMSWARSQRITEAIQMSTISPPQHPPQGDTSSKLFDCHFPFANPSISTSTSALTLPLSYVDYLTSNHIDVKYYHELLHHPVPRYIRVPLTSSITLNHIKQSFHSKYQHQHERHKNDNSKDNDSNTRGNVTETIVIYPTCIPSFYQLHTPSTLPSTSTSTSSSSTTIYNPPALKISSNPLYSRGYDSLYGMDLSSSIPVYALNIQSCRENILDLCCSPGNKMMLMVDMLLHQYQHQRHHHHGIDSRTIDERLGSVTGVDMNYQRLCTCRSILRKYQIPKNMYRLCLADGTTFSLAPPHPQPNPSQPLLSSQHRSAPYQYNHNRCHGELIDLTECGSDGMKKHMYIEKRYNISKAERKSLRRGQKRIGERSEYQYYKVRSKEATNAYHDTLPAPEDEDEPEAGETTLNNEAMLYDKVLVDAECTHDGSIKHLLKYIGNSAAASLHRSDKADADAFGDDDENEGRMKNCKEYSDRWANERLELQVLDHERLKGLQPLQRKLIYNGYKLLKPGGILVYSTCSLMRQQNEEIVEWLIQQFSRRRADDAVDAVSAQLCSKMPKPIVTSDPLSDHPYIKSTPTLYDAQGKLSEGRELYQIVSSKRYSPHAANIELEDADGNAEHQIHIGTEPQPDPHIFTPVYERSCIHDLDGNVIGHGMRFDPIISSTGGMFVCKIMKPA